MPFSPLGKFLNVYTEGVIPARDAGIPKKKDDVIRVADTGMTKKGALG
ncbi:hypothetical protein [Wolbachia endosymbiont (group A) of Yponomeuta plumbellus]|nr:hypothetical protein [Wolbachia endosymbiont (group A) of Yponomeuta plumbellus]